jgi:hypothetical protein
MPIAGRSYLSFNSKAITNYVLKRGASQTWDFSSLTGDDEKLESYYNPIQTSHGSSFPESNLALKDTTPDGFSYIRSSTSILEVLGVAQNGRVVRFDTPLNSLSLPITYGKPSQTNFKTVTSVENDDPGTKGYYDSIRTTITFYIVDTANAYGSIKTPNSTYEALQITRYGTFTSTTEVREKQSKLWMSIGSDTENTRKIDWFAKDIGVPVFSVNLTGHTGTTVEGVSWYGSTSNSPVLAINTANFNEHLVKIHPNPNNGNFSVQLPSTLSANSIRVSNVAGFEIEYHYDMFANTVSLSNALNGIYLLEVNTNQGIITKRILVNK